MRPTNNHPYVVVNLGDMDRRGNETVTTKSKLGIDETAQSQ